MRDGRGPLDPALPEDHREGAGRDLSGFIGARSLLRGHGPEAQYGHQGKAVQRQDRSQAGRYTHSPDSQKMCTPSCPWHLLPLRRPVRRRSLPEPQRHECQQRQEALAYLFLLWKSTAIFLSHGMVR